MKVLKLATCKSCGWVHFEVTLEHAIREVARFNEYFTGLSKSDQIKFYGGRGAALATYTQCMLCGGPHTNFRDFKKGDCPDGCTQSPIVHRSERLMLWCRYCDDYHEPKAKTCSAPEKK